MQLYKGCHACSVFDGEQKGVSILPFNRPFPPHYGWSYPLCVHALRIRFFLFFFSNGLGFLFSCFTTHLHFGVAFLGLS